MGTSPVSLHSPKTQPAFPRAAPTMSSCHVRLNARVVHGPFAPKWFCPVIPRLRSSEAWLPVLAKMPPRYQRSDY